MDATIIVTGANRGIGYAATCKLLERGCIVIAIARRAGDLEQLKDRFQDKLELVFGDVRDTSVFEAALAYAQKQARSIDGVLFNAGVLDPVSKLDAADVPAWRDCFDINLFSIVGALPVILPELRKCKSQSKSTDRNGRGKIVIVSSGAATGSYQGWSAYGCTKAAVNHLAQDLGVEEPDITTLSVRPGVVATDMQKAIREQHGASMDQEQHKKFTELHRAGDLVEPGKVADVLAMLVSEADHALSGKFVNWADFKDVSGSA